MRIAFVLAALGAGGAERVISLIATHWASQGHDVVVIAFDSPDDPVYHHFTPNIRLVRLNIPAAPGQLFAKAAQSVRRVHALRKTLKREHPDRIISFLTKINALVLLANLARRTPVIVSERNNPTQQTAHPLWQILLNRLYTRASAIVMQTQASIAVLPAAVHRRAVVIANPIAAAPPKSAAPISPPTVTAVGRLVPQKGFDLLLDAFAMVADDFPEWRLTIWGEGTARADLEAQINALGLQDRVRLPGLTSSPGEWVAKTTIFVLPSRFEGFPNVLGEAMAAGLPVLAYDCSFGPREMVRDRVDGLLVPAGEVQPLAEGLRQLMGNDALRQQLSSMARQRAADCFGSDHIMAQWDDLIGLA